MKRAIIIGGGVGPAAGLRLHRLILENTKAGNDQEHLKVVHMSFSDMIADRTKALSDGHPELSALGMVEIIFAAAGACDALGVPTVSGIPCNTFHAQPIWKIFTEKLVEKQGSGGQYPLLVNMIDETVSHIKTICPAGCSIGILSTNGTRREQIYSAPLSAAGFRIIEPEDQNAVHEMIYNPDWGLKASIDVSRRAKSEVGTQIDKLAAQGAALVILGCTELPLALDNGHHFEVELLDPMTVLARALVKAADPDKLTDS